MFIRIRKERFGYVLFERYTRDLHFVTTTEDLAAYTLDQLRQFLTSYYPKITADFRYELIDPPTQDLELAAPIGMYMEITRRCNLNCRHCYKPDDPGVQTLEFEAWRRLIQELHDIGVFEIRLCGNEPVISPHFRRICEFVSSLDMFLGVNTNGFYGEKAQRELIESRPDFVAVSVDGDEDTHDRIRGNGAYRKAVALLEKLRGAAVKRRINAVVSSLTLRTIEHTARLADKFDADISFLPFRPVGRNTAFGAECAIDKSQMLQAVQEIMRVRELFPRLLMLTYFDVLGGCATYHHSMDLNSPCPARKNGFIAYNGDFYPCDFLRYLGNAYHCGNVAESGFWLIWTTSPVLKRFQGLQHNKCKSCDHYMKKCYGGCISGSIASTGSPDDELCFVELIVK